MSQMIWSPLKMVHWSKSASEYAPSPLSLALYEIINSPQPTIARIKSLIEKFLHSVKFTQLRPSAEGGTNAQRIWTRHGDP